MYSQIRNIQWIVLFLVCPYTIAWAETVNITVSGISFEPKVIAIQPGDTVSWTGMTGHSTTLVSKLSPNGALEWDSRIGSDFENTFNEEGVYIYKCKPHSNLGMAGAIIVGNPTNIDMLREHGQNHNFKEIINQAIEYAEKYQDSDL